MVGKLRISGFIAWLMWLGVHLIYLTGFKNQVTALLHWTVTFLSNDRSERTATEQQIFARMALQRLPRGATELVSPPGAFTDRRAELEAIAAEEARLTDSGVRGRAEHRDTA
ncbi:MAG: NAD(P)/FAD-dependent oxidoreductase, partial [Marmoricola sp.]